VRAIGYPLNGEEVVSLYLNEMRCENEGISGRVGEWLTPVRGVRSLLNVLPLVLVKRAQPMPSLRTPFWRSSLSASSDRSSTSWASSHETIVSTPALKSIL
jgi:hypothetical protein